MPAIVIYDCHPFLAPYEYHNNITISDDKTGEIMRTISDTHAYKHTHTHTHINTHILTHILTHMFSHSAERGKTGSG